MGGKIAKPPSVFKVELGGWNWEDNADNGSFGVNRLVGIANRMRVMRENKGRASARPGKQTRAPPQAARSPETQHPRTPQPITVWRVGGLDFRHAGWYKPERFNGASLPDREQKRLDAGCDSQ
jgi:hypothetical protein